MLVDVRRLSVRYGAFYGFRAAFGPQVPHVARPSLKLGNRHAPADSRRCFLCRLQARIAAVGFHVVVGGHDDVGLRC